MVWGWRVVRESKALLVSPPYPVVLFYLGLVWFASGTGFVRGGERKCLLILFRPRLDTCFGVYEVPIHDRILCLLSDLDVYYVSIDTSYY